MQFSKSPLFTLNNIHYLCTENKYIENHHSEDFPEYQFEESDPENIHTNSLPIQIQNKIGELGDSYYTVAIIPHEKVSDFATKLKAHLKQRLEDIIKLQKITYEDLYDILPDMLQNLAALQDIDITINLYEIKSLVTQIDKFSKESLSHQAMF